jgi:hypothetical protein
LAKIGIDIVFCAKVGLKKCKNQTGCIPTSFEENKEWLLYQSEVEQKQQIVKKYQQHENKKPICLSLQHESGKTSV